MLIFAPGHYCAPVTAYDWEPVNNIGPKAPALSEVKTWSQWTFSMSARAFHQIGGNSEGKYWDRYYEAKIVTDENVSPSHIFPPKAVKSRGAGL